MTALTFQVHNEAITIPENIDCIRALTGIERDAARSIEKTNAALGVVKSSLPATTKDVALPVVGQEPPLDDAHSTAAAEPAE